MKTVEAYGHTLEVLEPETEDGIAHPGEGHEESTAATVLCPSCALAIMPETGEIVLLWMVNTRDYVVSVNDPHRWRHRKELAS